MMDYTYEDTDGMVKVMPDVCEVNKVLIEYKDGRIKVLKNGKKFRHNNFSNDPLKADIILYSPFENYLLVKSWNEHQRKFYESHVMEQVI